MNLNFLCLFVLFRLLKDWMMLTHIGECNMLYSIYWFKCCSRKTLTDTHTHTHLENMLNQLCGHPLAQSSWQIKLTIIQVSWFLVNDHSVIMVAFHPLPLYSLYFFQWHNHFFQMKSCLESQKKWEGMFCPPPTLPDSIPWRQLFEEH